MTLASLCLFLSTLSVSPERSQFRRYETIVLSCAANSTGWTVKRNTTHHSNQKCQFGWGVPKESSCKIDTAFPSDSGAYWCENHRGECSNVVNLTVTISALILEIPPYPVIEGDDVTINCSFKTATPASSDLSANFYKDGVLIERGTAGKMKISRISKSQQGFYKCEHASEGKSPESLLTVRARDHQTDMAATPESPPASPTPSPPGLLFRPKMICSALLFLFYCIPTICCVYKYLQWSRGRALAVHHSKLEEVAKVSVYDYLPPPRLHRC